MLCGLIVWFVMNVCVPVMTWLGETCGVFFAWASACVAAVTNSVYTCINCVVTTIINPCLS